jgi:hypothetical protein
VGIAGDVEAGEANEAVKPVGQSGPERKRTPECGGPLRRAATQERLEVWSASSAGGQRAWNGTVGGWVQNPMRGNGRTQEGVERVRGVAGSGWEAETGGAPLRCQAPERAGDGDLVQGVGRCAGGPGIRGQLLAAGVRSVGDGVCGGVGEPVFRQADAGAQDRRGGLHLDRDAAAERAAAGQFHTPARDPGICGTRRGCGRYG